MALIPKIKKDFSAQVKDPAIYGNNVVFIKGGATLVDEIWVILNDIKVDVQKVISDYVGANSRRLFNNFNDTTYVLIALDSGGAVEVIPNVSFNTKSYGSIKVFPDLSGKIPLIMVKLQQDGSSDLTAFVPITENDIEVYQGYGNFTLKGPQGPTGYAGITGAYSPTGLQGLTGPIGETGCIGLTGIDGAIAQGITGVVGLEGYALKQYVPVTGVYADFVADKTTVSADEPVNFENLSTGPVVTWHWDLGDGTVFYSQNVTHAYSTDGTFNVSLSVMAINGDTGINLKTNYINVVDEL